MEDNPTLLETLFDKAETYGKTTIKLATYQAIDTASDISASVVSKVILGLFAVMVFLMSTVGLALWIGDELGVMYYGFFAVAGIYLLLGLLIYLFRTVLIKNPVSNFVITKLKKTSYGDNQ